MVFARDGRTLYFRAGTGLFAASIPANATTGTGAGRGGRGDGATPPAPIDLGAPVISSLATNRTRTGWLWLAEGGAKPPALCYAARLGDACTVLPLPALAPADEVAIDARPWPRRYSSDGVNFTLYQPDVDVFTGNKLEGRVPMAVVTGKVADQAGKTSDQMRYGVIWFRARTETDKEAREVTLHDISLDRASFPSDKVGYVAVQDAADGPPTFAKTTDGGATWIEKDLPAQANAADGYPAIGVGFVTEKIGWMSPEDPALPTYRTSDGGETWKVDPKLASPINRFRFVDKRTAYAVGGAVWKLSIAAP